MPLKISMEWPEAPPWSTGWPGEGSRVRIHIKINNINIKITDYECLIQPFYSQIKYYLISKLSWRRGDRGGGLAMFLSDFRNINI